MSLFRTCKVASKPIDAFCIESTTSGERNVFTALIGILTPRLLGIVHVIDRIGHKRGKVPLTEFINLTDTTNPEESLRIKSARLLGSP